MLSADQITLHYGRKRILDDISFTCAPGEMVALCGPNGAGKSSLLKALAGDQRISGGHIQLNGIDLAQLSPAKMAQMRAVMPQHVDVAFSFKAISVVAMGLLFVPDPREKQAIIELVTGLLHLDSLLERPYQLLSGGERQRVQLARVIGQLLQQGDQQPRYLLLDECSSAMDMAMVHLAFSVIRQLVDDDHFGPVGVVAVVHDLNIASLYADRIVLLHDQQIDCDGSPEQVITRQQIEKVFRTPVAIIDHPEHHKPMIIQSGGVTN